MSLLTIFGYLLCLFNLTLKREYLLGLFLVTALLGQFYLRRIRESVEKISISYSIERRASNLSVIFILLLPFILYGSLSWPSFFPVGFGVDGSQHFALSNYIWKNQELFLGRAIPGYMSAENPRSVYPFGYHLNIAFLSWVYNMPPVQLIYPFTVFLISLIAGTLYGITVNLGIGGKITSLIPGFLSIISVYTFNALIQNNFWPMLMGAFLTILFYWSLDEYLAELTLSKMIPLIMIEACILMTYTFWGVVSATALFLVLFVSKNLTLRRKLTHFLLFTGSVFSTTGLFIRNLMHSHQMAPTQAYGATSTADIRVFNLAWIQAPSPKFTPFITLNLVVGVTASGFFILALLGVVRCLKHRINGQLLFLTASILLFQFAAWFSWVVLHFTTAYLYFKWHYLLAYPATIFVFITIRPVLSYLEKKTRLDSQVARSVLILTMILFTLFAASFINNEVKPSGYFRALAITPDEYHIGVWVLENLAGRNITFIADTPPRILWFSSVSGIVPHFLTFYNISVDGSTLKIDPDSLIIQQEECFRTWEATAGTGEIIVILKVDEINLTISRYNLLKKLGAILVLEFKG